MLTATHKFFIMKQLYATFLLLAAFAATSFAQNNNIVVSFDHKAGADPMVLGQTVFSIWNGKKVLLDRAQFYVSDISLRRADNSSVLLSDKYLLVNANAPTAEHNLGTWPIESVQGSTLHLGITKAVNHSDPAIYPAGHPLAPQNPSMHWGWAAGYRFIAMEGKVDNDGDGVPETVFEFHNVGDDFYKAVEMSGTATAANGALHLRYTLNYAQLFKNLSMTGNLIQHGNAPLNVAMNNNAVGANFLAMNSASSAHDVAANSLQVSASPNPFSAETLLRYELPAADALTLTLSNALGQTVRTLSGLPASGSVLLERGDLPTGLYQCAFWENGGLLARKQLIVN
jgi:hypothetical protein